MIFDRMNLDDVMRLTLAEKFKRHVIKSYAHREKPGTHCRSRDQF
jgi:hypothetical protein